METKIKVLILIVLSPLLAFSVFLFAIKPNNLRLPTHIWPEAYNITIQPFMSKEDGDLQYKFAGEVEILVKPLIATKMLVLHSKELDYTVREYWTTEKPHFKQRLYKFRFVSETDKMIIYFPKFLLPSKKYTFHFRYIGNMNNRSTGVFYRNNIDSNDESWIVATQFQPSDARRAFPCFDEPMFKAIFQVQIVRPTHMKSYSNTKRTCSYITGKTTVDKFAKTPIMPVYSVALLIASFKERTDEDGFSGFSVLAKPADYSLTNFSFNEGRQLLFALSQYLNFDYYSMGIDKLHYVALPALTFSGMENWGLVIAKEEQVLCNENASRTLIYGYEKENITKLLAHELSHMWFGNLVTCEWWSYIWLNEGFATYFAYFGPAILNNGSENQKWESNFYLEVIQNSLLNDISANVTALNIYIRTLRRSTYFGYTPYRKGAVFINMVKYIIGERYFQLSLQKYLQTFKYKTTTPGDLFQIWRAYWPKIFLAYFEAFCYSYTEKPGYPLITINVANNGLSIKLTQQRLTKNFKTDVIDNFEYVVPISLTTNLETDFSNENIAPKFFLATTHHTHNLITRGPVKWLIVNIQAKGLYRVNYDSRNWHNIAEALLATNWSGIHFYNRAQIVADVHHLFCAELIDMNLMLKIFAYLQTETYFVPWKVAIKSLTSMEKFLRANYKSLGHFIQNISSNLYDQLGFYDKSSDDLDVLRNRMQILSLACKYGNTNCLETAKFYSKNNVALEKLDSERKFIIYCTMLRQASNAIYERFIKLYSETTDTVLKKLFLKALGCVRNETLVEKYFWYIVHNVPKEAKREAFESLFSENIDQAFKIYKIITNNFQKISSSFGNTIQVLEIIVKISIYFTELYQKKDLERFIQMPLISTKTYEKNLLIEALSVLNEQLRCLEAPKY